MIHFFFHKNIVTEWDVDETLAYLKHAATLETRNDFKVTQACRYLTQLATDSSLVKKLFFIISY